jgi:hypothetical protein
VRESRRRDLSEGGGCARHGSHLLERPRVRRRPRRARRRHQARDRRDRRLRAYYLIKTADGAVSISVFDDEAGSEESTAAAAAYVRENLPDYAGSPPQVSSGEVLVTL